MAAWAPVEPDERLLAIRGYTADVVGCRPDQVTAVARLEGGNRHHVFRVSYVDATGAGTDVVVRVALGDGPEERAQAAREARVLEKVGGVAAPSLYDFSPTREWFAAPAMCLGFERGHPIDLRDAASSDVERLGSLVARVHAQPVGDLAAWFGGAGGDVVSYAADRLRSILATMVWVRPPLGAAIRTQLRDAATSVEQSWEHWREAPSFTTGDALALLHGDIAFGNVLWGPGPVLIDWEYARLGDPADEIAYLFDQNDLDASLRTAFWRGYGADDRERVAQVMDRVTWWEPVTLLGSALWWAERLVRRTEAEAAGTVDPEVPREAGYYLDEVARRLARFGT